MRSFLYSFVIFLIYISCNGRNNNTVTRQERKLPANMVYTYECVNENSGSNNIRDYLSKADEYLNEFATQDIMVTENEQNEFGDQFLNEAKKNGSFVIDETGTVNAKLKNVLANLLRVRENPSSIKYSIYLIKDSIVNAYTAGGKIFVTSAIVAKCKNEDQLYAIIGHEIGHNEKGHIKATLKQLKASNRYLGVEWGNKFLTVKKLLTGKFNQKYELESDYYGLDLTWKLGFDICAIKSFWDMMAANEERGLLLDFFGTHPYSDIRSNCLVKHIKTNFKQTCE